MSTFDVLVNQYANNLSVKCTIGVSIWYVIGYINVFKGLWYATEPVSIPLAGEI